MSISRTGPPSSQHGLTNGEIRFISDLLDKFFSEKAIFSEWVQVAESEEKNKFHKRLLVVGHYRLFFIVRSHLGGKKSLDKSIHLYDIKELKYEKQALFIVTHVRTVLVKSEKIPEIIRDIRNSYTRISWGFGRYAMVLNVPKELLLPTTENQDPGIGEGLLSNYVAQCNYLNVSIHYPFVRFVEDLVKKKTHIMDLSYCPGIEAKSEMSLDINAIFNSLALNSYFRAIIMRDIPLQRNSDSIAYTMQYSSSITKLVISKIDGTVDFAALGQALQSNKFHSLEYIDFSHNEINLKDITSLSNSFKSFKHALRTLILTNCGLNAKGISTLFEAFEANFQVSLTVQHLGLSQNKFEETGSIAMANWLSKVREYSALVRVELAGTFISLALISTWLRPLILLGYLDLSNNKIDKESGHKVREIVETCPQLTTVKLSQCKMTPDTVEEITTALLKNQKLTPVQLDLSLNEIHIADCIKKPLQGKYSLRTLDISGTKIKSLGLISILEELSTNCMTLYDLMIGKNISKNEPPEHIEKLSEALGQFIVNNSNIRKLSLAGCKGSRFKRMMIPLFSHLEYNSTLEELNIEENRIKDNAFFLLLESLKINKGLKILKMGGNRITFNGLLCLHTCLSDYNKTICHIQWDDMFSSDQKKDRINEIISEVHFHLRTNQIMQNFQRKSSEEMEEPPTTPTPLANLPEHLLPLNFHNTEALPDVNESQVFRPSIISENKNNTDFWEEEEDMDEEQLMELRSSKVEDDKNEVVLSSGNETPKNGGTPKGSWKRALRSQNLNDSTKFGFKPLPEQKMDASEESVIQVMRNYIALDETELTLKVGDQVKVVEKYSDSEWWKGQHNNDVGFFPFKFVQQLDS